MYSVLLSETAVKQLEKLEPGVRKTVKSHLEFLSEDRFHRRAGCDVRQLRGFVQPRLYRLRAGNMRASYFVEAGNVKVTEIFRRRKGLRWLD